MTNFDQYNFHPWIEPLVSNLIEGDLGLCAGRASINNILCSRSSSNNSNANDTFTVTIPYAGMNLNWQILFEGADSSDLPDFLIHDECGFDPDYEDILHLVNWDPENQMALLNVMKDLLRLYKKHHLKLILNENTKFTIGVGELMASQDYPLVDVSVTKSAADEYGGMDPRTTINVLVRIKLDVSQIPDICFKDAPAEDPSFLHPVLQIRASESGKIVPQLYVPRRMEHILGGRNSMKLPAFSRQNTPLLEYVQNVDKHLNDLILVLRDGHSKRREYIAAFLCVFADNIIEYDAEEFRRITLLFSHEDFYFLVHVALAKLFPQEQPELTFQSVYHTTKTGALYQVSHSSYPYSPRWSGNEMAKRTRTYIMDRIEAFKAGCMKNGVV